VSEVKAIIKKQVDEHWDVIRTCVGLRIKKLLMRFSLEWLPESPLLELQLRPEAGFTRFWPFADSRDGLCKCESNYMPEHNVPEMHQYDFTEYNFYDVGISVHMGIRHFLHFARLAKEKYSGRDIARHGLMDTIQVGLTVRTNLGL